METPLAAPKETGEPTHLTEQYYKARKNLALFSGLLFAWEFIGIDVTPRPIESLDVQIKTPEAFPYILLILVLYFTLRVVIEWHQSSELRRSMWVSRVDYALSLSIPIIAIVTFVTQRLLEIQIAEAI